MFSRDISHYWRMRSKRALAEAFNDADRASSISTPDGRVIGFPLKIRTRRPLWRRIVGKIQLWFNRMGSF